MNSDSAWNVLNHYSFPKLTTMAISASLKIEGVTYDTVISVDYQFTQAIDITGRPSDRPRGGTIQLTLPAPDNNNLFFHEWMCDREALHDGEIRFTVTNDGNVSDKTLNFSNAYCVGLHEHFDSTEKGAMTLQITLSVGSITFGDKCEFKLID